MSHFTVEVNVKETIQPEPVMNPSGYPVKTLGGADLMTERRVVDRLRVVVSAETEEEAVNKAIRMLRQAGEPQ